MLREFDTDESTDAVVARPGLSWHGGLRGFLNALEARLPGSAGHARRVASTGRSCALTLDMDPPDVLRVERAALVHDVGKIIVSSDILQAPRRLLPQEFEQVKRHTTFGSQLVASLGDPLLTEIVRHHHERIDGSGYPDGLHGAAISLGARIVAVADTFDALTSSRPYREACSIEAAVEVIESESGMTLDPRVVGAFLTRGASSDQEEYLRGDAVLGDLAEE